MSSKNKNLAQNIIAIYYAIPETVESESVGSTSFHRKIVFKAGYGWEEIEISKKSAKFNEKSTRKDAGILWKQSVDAFAPGEDDGNLATYAKITNRPVLVKLIYSNGQSKLIGNLNGSKPRLLPDLAIGSGKSGRSLNFDVNDTHQAYWLEE